MRSAPKIGVSRVLGVSPIPRAESGRECASLRDEAKTNPGNPLNPYLNLAALERALVLACEQEELARSTRVAIEAALGKRNEGAGYIPLKVAAYDWGVSDDTVRRWAVEGRIRAEKLVGRWYVQREMPVDHAVFAEVNRTA